MKGSADQTGSRVSVTSGKLQQIAQHIACTMLFSLGALFLCILCLFPGSAGMGLRIDNG